MERQGKALKCFTQMTRASSASARESVCGVYFVIIPEEVLQLHLPLAPQRLLLALLLQLHRAHALTV